MPRAPSPERVKAKEVYISSGRKISLPKIAQKFGVSVNTVKTWKKRDEWDAENATETVSKRVQKKVSNAKKVSGGKPKRSRGGQPGNINAVGGGAPRGNQNSVTHGAYSRIMQKYMDEEEAEIFYNEHKDDPLDILYAELNLLNAQEMRLQRRIFSLRNDHGGDEIKALTVKGVERMEVTVKYGAFPEDEKNASGVVREHIYPKTQKDTGEKDTEMDGHKTVSTRTQTESNFEKLRILEEQLVKVQREKVKVALAIESINERRELREDDDNEEKTQERIKAFVRATAPDADAVRTLFDEDIDDEKAYKDATEEQ